MSKSRRLLALLLALVMVFLVACSTGGTTPTETGGETTAETGAETTTETGAESTGEAPAEGTLRVVTSGELNGHYINGLSNSSYDVWIKNLLWAYGLYATDEAGQFVLNETVNASEPTTTDNEDGSKTYTFTINDNLVWNDGTPITAKDYVFAVLFTSSNAVTKVGATGGFDSLVGYAEYKDGSSESFPGVKLIDDHSFEMTISADNVPYFYEVSAVSAAPYPMHHWAPDLVIGEDGSSLAVAEGYELSEEDRAEYVARVDEAISTKNEELAAVNEAEEVDAEAVAALEEEIAALEADKENPSANVAGTLLESAAYFVYQEEIFAPKVTSGAYNFLSLENQVATVELNPNYVGDFRGDKPTINRVEIRNINEDLDVDAVINGEADIVAGVIEGDKIEKAIASDSVTPIDYKRNGYGYFGFHTDKAPVNDMNVRQAVAWLMDRTEIVEGVLGGYGEVGQGMYGLSQWTYVAKGEEFLDLISERDTVYTLNVDKANELLDQTPYTFEADGTTPWDAAKAVELAESEGDNFSYFRHDAEGNQLQINHAAGAENVGNSVASQLTPNGRLAGLNYTMSVIDFNILLENFYNMNQTAPEDRTYHAYTLATSFTPVFDPYYSYHSDWLGTTYNTEQVNDEEADRLVTELRRIDPTETDAYAEKWLEFQLWFNEYLPQIPLYSNQYFDIYNNRITGLETTPDWDWSADIADIQIVE